jgi:transposase
MESVGKKPRRHRRAFAPEFKAEIVELCQRGDRSVGQVARNFDRHPGTAPGSAPASHRYRNQA